MESQLAKMREELRTILAKKVFVQRKDERIAFHDDPEGWLFDFRRVLMNGHVADIISELFYETHKDKYPFQLSSMEVAGVPLVTSLMTKFYTKGHTDINAFFVRKSRKKDGLLKMIEGEVVPGVPVIMVDDIMNSGNSTWRQVTALDEFQCKFLEAWSILRFRDEAYYTRFHARNIGVESLFDLNDLTDLLGERVKNFSRIVPETPVPMPFTALWKFKADYPNIEWVFQKSQPVMDDERIYFGAGGGKFYAINKTDGSLAWDFNVKNDRNNKCIFSSPVIFEDLVIFGAYDGNLYALERATGKVRWINFEGDYIGSSPALAADLGLIFIGLEFGLLTKRGGLIAIEVKTGKTVWLDRQHPAFTHSSPLYIKEHKQVIIGSNDGKARLYDAKTGQKIWECTTFGGGTFNPKNVSGFGEGDIKESFAYDKKRDYIIFGSMDGCLYIINRKHGHIVHHHRCAFGIFSTPLIYEDRVYFTSVDKQLRCLDLKTFKIVFEFSLDSTRIYSSPVIINGRLYVGTNAARLHELDPKTGARLAYLQVTERITNEVIYDETNDTYYLPTFANEVIALKREPSVALKAIK